MRGTKNPIKDIYSGRTQSEARKAQKLPSTSPVATPPPTGISHAPIVEQKQVMPEIAPMRRGRPNAPAQSPAAPKPVASPQGDPFAALDSKDYHIRAGAVDELASKYPSIDDFSIALDKRSSFQFPSSRPNQSLSKPEAKLNERVTNALADEVFASTRPVSSATSSTAPKATLPLRTTSLRTTDPSAQAISQPVRQPALQQPAPIRPGYTSTGTMTSPSPPNLQSRKPPAPIKLPEISKRPIWRVPEPDRSLGQPRASPTAQAAADSLQPAKPQRPAMLETTRSKSSVAVASMAAPASARPALETRRISQLYTGEAISRARSVNAGRPRPVSAAYVDSNLDYLRAHEQESAERRRPSLDHRRSSRSVTPMGIPEDDTSIENHRDYLRNLEGDKSRSRDSSVGHRHRVSMPSIMGKFGDAFKRFERTKSSEGSPHEDVKKSPLLGRTPSPQPQEKGEDYHLSPILGSETTGSTREEQKALDSEEDVPPETRRELERRRLSAEERRVAQAAQEYRSRRLGGGAPAVPNKASAIQQRVQAFLDGGQQSPKPKRTAEGYGRYTEEEQAERQQQAAPPQVRKGPPPAIARKPFTAPATPLANNPAQKLSYSKVRQAEDASAVQPSSVASSTMGQALARRASRPNAPPKPKTLKTGSSGVYQGRPSSSSSSQSQSQSQAGLQGYENAARGSSLAALLARDSEGVAAPGSNSEQRGHVEQGDVANTVYTGGVDDWEADFSKRYPSLSGIEMVETEISANDVPQRRGIRVKEV